MVDGSMRCLGPSSHLKARFANGKIWLITSTLSSFSELEITIIVSPSTTGSNMGLNIVCYPIISHSIRLILIAPSDLILITMLLFFSSLLLFSLLSFRLPSWGPVPLWGSLRRSDVDAERHMWGKFGLVHRRGHKDTSITVVVDTIE